MLTIRLLMFACFLIYAATQLAGCEDNTVLVDQAYAEGHYAGRIWCGKQGVERQHIELPRYTGKLKDAWWLGFALGERAAGCTADHGASP